MEDEGRLTVSSDFGNLLRRHRLAAGLSQEALAERARMSTNGIGALERGHRRTPQRETLALLVSALALNAEQRREFEAAAIRPRILRRGAPVTVGPWLTPASANLPLALTSFIGRDVELAELVSLIRSQRFVTITGAGGIGKTQAALHVASALEDDVAGAIVFVPLAQIADASRVVPAIAAAVGAQEVPQRPLLDTVLAFVRKRKFLLVIDNAEHLIEETARVAETLLQGSPELRILATSRTAFKASGERVYRLPSLTLDNAVKLFADRAKAVDFHFAINEQNARAAANLCRRLEGIPLAIELAAARVEMLSIEAINAHLDDRLHMLTRGSRTSASRQQTMRATIEWSYKLLSGSEQRVFERLSVFAGGGTLAAATIVCDGDDVAEAEIVDLLASLVTTSLLEADLARDEARYRLLEPFRQYARERLAARGEYDDAAHRHAIACLERANRFESAYQNEPDSAYRPIADTELDNWRAALDWTLVKRQDVPLGQQIAGKLWALWLLNGRFTEGRDWTRLALELTDESTPERVVADLARTCADVAINVHFDEEVISAGNRALTLYSAIGDRVSIAHMLTVLGFGFLYSDVPKGNALIEDGLALARQANSWRETIFALRMRAMAKAASGDEAAGRRDALEALRLAQEHGDYHEALFATLTFAARCSDDPELGLQYLTPIAELSPNPLRIDLLASALVRVSVYSLWLRRYDQALAKAQEALKLDGLHERPYQTDIALTTIAILVALQPKMIEGDELANSARAARLLGLASDRDPLIDTSERQRMLLAEALALLGESIGKPRLEELMAEGSAMTREQAVSEAFRLCGEHV